jgi:hypothetical protein
MSRRRLLSTVSLVLIHAQRVEPKPPINSLLIYRNLLPTFDLCRLSGELDKFGRHIEVAGRSHCAILSWGLSGRSFDLPLAVLVESEIINFSIEAGSQGLQIFSYTRTSPEPASKYVHKLGPRNPEAQRHVRLTKTTSLNFIAKIRSDRKRHEARGPSIELTARQGTTTKEIRKAAPRQASDEERRDAQEAPTAPTSPSVGR